VTSPIPDRLAFRLSPSALVLVAANLVPLAGVLFFGWSVFSTLLLFWVENVIVGAFNVLRMLVAQPQIGVMWAAKLFMIPFFTFHYGMFVTVHGLFVLTLVPIAIAYHLAHYLSFLVMAGQYLIPLASDPFGLGWDLFGTKNHFIRIGLVDARAVWYISIGAIVIGHVVAVYLAHRISLRIYSDRHVALRSQWPMVALMVCYTITSLWIIAQPIVKTR